MKRVTYATVTFDTGDDIADALLDVVAALGSNDSVRHVSIPARTSTGREVETVEFVIGPSSEIIAVPIEGEPAEIVDDEKVEELRTIARSLRAARPVAEDEPDNDAFDFSNS